MTMQRQLCGVLRASALAALIAAGALLWIGHRVHARSERFLIELGDHMMQYAGARHQTEAQPLSINGASFFLRIGSVDADVGELLDHFHAKCLDRNGRLHAQWANVAERRKIELPSQISGLDGVFRGEANDAGVVACFETGRDVLPPELLLARARRALQTGDLSALGDIRYVYVKRGASSSLFVALWSEGAVNFRAMFPARGDAPGRDLDGVPRPSGSTRILATEAKQGDAAFNVYRSSAKPAAELTREYSDTLRRAGFAIVRENSALLSAHDQTHMLTISVREDPRRHQTLVALASQPDHGSESTFKQNW